MRSRAPAEPVDGFADPREGLGTTPEGLSGKVSDEHGGRVAVVGGQGAAHDRPYIRPTGIEDAHPCRLVRAVESVMDTTNLIDDVGRVTVLRGVPIARAVKATRRELARRLEESEPPTVSMDE